MGKIAVQGQQGFRFRTTCGQHNVFPNTDGIAGKPESFRFRHNKTSGRLDPFGKNRLPVVIEGVRKVQEFTAAQGTQAGIKVLNRLSISSSGMISLWNQSLSVGNTRISDRCR